MPQDVTYTPDYDLQFDGNDFAIGDSDEQEVQSLIVHAPGNFKQTPTAGAGATQFFGSPFGNATIIRIVREQLKADNKVIQFINVQRRVDDLTISVKANGKEVSV